ncbi:MAG: hypothetical protein AAF502_01535 [Bacteroidota bacterium]
MKFEQQNKLKEALDRLPVYKPGHEVWDNISSQLGYAPKSWLAKTLPVYKAPESIWKAISTQLDQAKPTTPVIKKIYRYAAVLAGALVASFFLFQQFSDTRKEVVSFSVESFNKMIGSNNWEDDESAFAMLDEYCENKSYSCTTEEFVSLKAELDELNSAHSELKAVLTAYNEDPILLEQLTLIERQRTDLLKTLFAKI